MSAITDTLAVREYKGDSVGGGHQAYGVKIDTAPIDKLAAQTFYERTNLWERANKERDAAAFKVAEISGKLNVTSTDPRIYKILSEKKEKIISLMKNGIPRFQDGEKAYVEFETELEDFFTLQAKGAAHNVKVNTKRENNAVFDADRKKAEDGYLDASIEKSFENGVEYYLRQSPLVETEYKPDVKDFIPKLPKDLKKNKVQTFVIEPNTNKTFELGYSDYNTLWQQAHLLPTDVGDNFVDDPKQKDYTLNKAKHDLKVAMAKSGEFTDATVAKRNEIAKAYYEKLKLYNETPENLRTGQPPYKPDFIEAAENYNENAKRINNILSQQEKRGGKAGQQKVPTIDLENDVTREELAFLSMVSQVDNSIEYKEEGVNTGTAVTREGNQLDYKSQAEGRALQRFLATKRGGGDSPTTGENRNFMDLTGYTGSLTTYDIAAIDPTLVTITNGLAARNTNNPKTEFEVLPNGDVAIYYNGIKNGLFGKNEPSKIINKSKYQKESVGITQTVLKDRKGEEGNPFTFTGATPSGGSGDIDLNKLEKITKNNVTYYVDPATRKVYGADKKLIQ